MSTFKMTIVIFHSVKFLRLVIPQRSLLRFVPRLFATYKTRGTQRGKIVDLFLFYFNVCICVI